MQLGKSKYALNFIFLTLLIDITGLGIIIPVMPKLIGQLTGEGLSVASEYGGWLTFAYAFMQFIFAPILGNLSDKYGRRPVLLLSLLGFGIDYLFLAFAPSIFWLFVGRIIAGIAGASMTTAMAYIADVSTPEKRAQNFGLIGAAFGLGFIIGPVLGGVLGQFGTRIPFFAAAGLALLNFLYGYFILPESLTKENRRPFNFKTANAWASLARLKRYPKVLSLAGALILVYLASYALQSVWTYYNMYKFGWTEALVGYSLGFVGITIAVVQGGLIRIIIPKLGQERSLYIGLALYSFGYILFAFASESWMMFAFMIPYSLGGIAGPALQGIMSNQVPDNEQGELQGTLTGLMSLTAIFGPLLMTHLFAAFTGKQAYIEFPGAPFLVGAVLLSASSIWAYRSLHGPKA
ncbi:MAG: TCR/Tet family MFS transporter [Sphingobacteriales bacterium]|nr:TCR/Tet family MFS transporter [Sphingobacteriales bacterium]